MAPARAATDVHDLPCTCSELRHRRRHIRAWDDDSKQPRAFRLGEPMILEDSAGERREVRIVEVIGRSSLLVFR